MFQLENQIIREMFYFKMHEFTGVEYVGVRKAHPNLRAINKILLIFTASCIGLACSNKVQDFNSQCQSGWEQVLPLSDTIYNKLLGKKFQRYISLKNGNDRGAYSFYFLGQTENSGLFLYADKNQITISDMSTTDIAKVFSLLPNDMETINGYTGSGDIWAHLSCEYMKINTSKEVKTFSFLDSVLIPSDADPASRHGVEILESIKSSLKAYLDDFMEKRPDTLTSIKVEAIPDLEKNAIKSINARKTKYPLFYEIPN